MNRRHFLAASLGAPLALQAGASLKTLPVVVPPSPEPAPLTFQEQRTLRILQDNMRKMNAYPFSQTYYNHIGLDSSSPCRVFIGTRHVPESWIEDELPRQFARTILRKVAGIQPMQSPCGYGWLRAPKYYNERYLDESIQGNIHTPGTKLLTKNFQPLYVDDHGIVRSMECVQDWRSSGMRWSEDQLMPSFPVERITVQARSHKVAGNDFSSIQVFETLEQAAIRTMLALVMEKQPYAYPYPFSLFASSNIYVMCYESDRKWFTKWHQTIIAADKFLSGIVPEGHAVIGYKESDFNASFYVTPYIPLQREQVIAARDRFGFRRAEHSNAETFKVRYGLTAAHWVYSEDNSPISSSFETAHYSLDQFRPALYLLKV